MFVRPWCYAALVCQRSTVRGSHENSFLSHFIPLSLFEMSHTTMIRWNVWLSRQTGEVTEVSWEGSGRLAQRLSVTGFCLPVSRLLLATTLKMNVYFVKLRGFSGEPTSLNPEKKPLPVASAASWREATQRNLSWKQSSSSAEVTALVPRIRGHLSSSFAWARLESALLAKAHKCS